MKQIAAFLQRQIQFVCVPTQRDRTRIARVSATMCLPHGPEWIDPSVPLAIILNNASKGAEGTVCVCVCVCVFPLCCTISFNYRSPLLAPDSEWYTL